MKLAGVSITYNDGYKIKEWTRWYEEYKDELYKHIIVDNGSESEYQHQVESLFKDAIIIKRTTNGGCTSAYNDGIKLALEDPEVTHIALIGNDIRISNAGLTKCVELLDSDKELGMVAPVLLNADTDIVSDFGCSINNDLTMNPFGAGLKLDNLNERVRFCDAVTGGMNVSKRSFYETVGLQDEDIFMYSDEVDMAFRAKNLGVKMAVTKEAKAWHQHIVPPMVKKRHPYSSFLMARNKVYLANKHFGKKKANEVFKDFFFGGLKHYLINIVKMDFDKAQSSRWRMIGAWKGWCGDMRTNKYSQI